jgi:hypothetical protein
MRLHLATIVGGHVEQLPFMLAHYRQLGIESFVVHQHLVDADDPNADAIRRAADAYECRVANTTIGSWQTLSQADMWAETMREGPDDWYVLADQDELQTYPDDLSSILTYCQHKGYDCVSGALLDRLAADGSFPRTAHDRPIWLQYPLASLLSFTVLGARTHKIVAARGRVRVSTGHHSALNGTPCPLQDVFIPVHHFKWTAGVVERSAARAKTYRESGLSYWSESDRFVRYVEAHGGRIDLNDRRLMIAECEQAYPYWKTFTVIAAARVLLRG